MSHIRDRYRRTIILEEDEVNNLNPRYNLSKRLLNPRHLMFSGIKQISSTRQHELPTNENKNISRLKYLQI